jgi:hypothetical protein
MSVFVKPKGGNNLKSKTFLFFSVFAFLLFTVEVSAIDSIGYTDSNPSYSKVVMEKDLQSLEKDKEVIQSTELSFTPGIAGIVFKTFKINLWRMYTAQSNIRNILYLNKSGPHNQLVILWRNKSNPVIKTVYKVPWRNNTNNEIEI